MNKKQAGIIVALLALIVCAGILAARVNSPLNEGDNGGVLTFSTDKGTSSKSDFFVTAKLDRDNATAAQLAQIKTVMDDKNISQTQRDEAAKKHLAVTAAQENQNKIEQALMTKGFENAICSIENNTRARITVKAKEITDQQRKMINDVAMSIQKFEQIELQAKQ